MKNKEFKFEDQKRKHHPSMIKCYMAEITPKFSIL